MEMDTTMVKKFDPDAELRKVGAKIRKEQKASTERFIKDLEKGAKDNEKSKRND